MRILPPGTLFQLMHLRNRLKSIKPGIFIEVGAGSGEITKLLIDFGWKGIVFELNKNSRCYLEN